MSATDARIVVCDVCGTQFALADIIRAQPSPMDATMVLVDCPLHGHSVMVPVRAND